MTNMEPIETMEIKDNTFARQFETIVPEGLLSVEYSFQEKKIFLNQNQLHQKVLTIKH